MVHLAHCAEVSVEFCAGDGVAPEKVSAAGFVQVPHDCVEVFTDVLSDVSD